MAMPIMQSPASNHRAGSTIGAKNRTQPIGTGSSISDQASQYRENDAVQSLEQSVQQRAKNDPQAFRNALDQAYGGKADPAALDKMTSMAANGKLPLPEKVVFVDAGTLGPGALGAYDSANGGTIYLDRSLLNDPKRLESVYTEELGHHLDAQLGGPDAAGDEGAIFSKSLLEGEVGSEELAELKSEDDSGFISVDGKRIAVEFRSDGPDTSGMSDSSSDDSSSSSDSDSSSESGSSSDSSSSSDDSCSVDSSSSSDDSSCSPDSDSSDDKSADNSKDDSSSDSDGDKSSDSSNNSNNSDNDNSDKESSSNDNNSSDSDNDRRSDNSNDSNNSDSDSDKDKNKNADKSKETGSDSDNDNKSESDKGNGAENGEEDKPSGGTVTVETKSTVYSTVDVDLADYADDKDVDTGPTESQLAEKAAVEAAGSKPQADQVSDMPSIPQPESDMPDVTDLDGQAVAPENESLTEKLVDSAREVHDAISDASRTAGDAITGFLDAGLEAAEGTVTLAANTVNTAVDMVVGPVVDTAEVVTGVQASPLLPDAQRGYDNYNKAAEALESIVTDPVGTVEAVVEPIKSEWEAGNKAEAVGRGVFEAGSLLVGGAGVAKGLNKAGSVPDGGKAPDVEDVAASSVAGKTAYAADEVAPVYGKKGIPDDETAQAAKAHNDKLDETYGEWKGPADYSHIKNPSDVDLRKPTPRQNEQMKAANMEQNGGILRSDLDGTPMVDSVQSEKGVTPPQNEVAIDHIHPYAEGGKRSNDNLQLLTREQNGIKSDKIE